MVTSLGVSTATSRSESIHANYESRKLGIVREFAFQPTCTFERLVRANVLDVVLGPKHYRYYRLGQVGFTRGLVEIEAVTVQRVQPGENVI